MYRYIKNAYICIHKTAMVIQTKQNWTIKKTLKMTYLRTELCIYNELYIQKANNHKPCKLQYVYSMNICKLWLHFQEYIFHIFYFNVKNN